MAEEPKYHIRLEGFSERLNYKYPTTGFGGSISVKQRNRAVHGANILRQLQEVRNQLNISRDAEIPEGILRDDAIYVDFISEWGYPLKFESLEQAQENPKFTILNIREEKRERDSQPEVRYHVAVMMTQGGISQFIKKVEKYLTENVKNKSGEDTGKPQNQPLINNIQRIQSATLESFWTDAPEISFPNQDETTWWEVWFRRTRNDNESIERTLHNLSTLGIQISASELVFPEHKVRLIRGTALQLSQSLMLLDNLAELRKPQEISDFVTHDHVSHEDKLEWLEEITSRVDSEFNENSVLVCLLDSGVNNNHPLIAPFLPDHQRYSYKPSDWGMDDSWPNGGHGTGVAGLALYGDLTEALDTPYRIRIAYGLESFKIFQNSDPSNPEFYGPITETACALPFIDKPDNSRVFCMTITAKDLAFRGRPSAWSAAVDKISFGTTQDPANPQLFILSGGNVAVNNHTDYPDKNILESIHDPAQAYNALTVGSYTRKDRVDQALWPGWRGLANSGGMAPSNSTSTTWEHQWPIKPDIVMEGGNSSTNEFLTADLACLKVLTVDKDYPTDIFLPFGDTSGATALAAKMAAELRTIYPNYWPETIRALMVHSAEWTETMLGGRSVNSLTETERRVLLRSVGYGVPIIEKAIYSAKNSLTLIAERYIQPYRLSGSTVKYNDYHLFSLPWPSDILGNDLFDQDVTLKLTLSYYIEPNPGSRNRKYANNFHYHSHSLNFYVIKAGETLEQFKRRISASADSSEEERDGSEEPWVIKRVRSRGSVMKDFITMSGADMARRNIIAIYPKSGWYRTRKKLGKTEASVRYSLIVSIETPATDVDIYTPVFTQITNTITV